MRIAFALTLTVSAGALALPTGCAGNALAPTSLVPGTSSPLGAALRSRQRVNPLGTCTDERHLRAKMSHGPLAKPAKSPGTPYLYVADNCVPSIDVLYSSNYSIAGSITSNVSIPFDVFLDSKRNLYVANGGTSTVTEYAPGNWSVPSFTYSANMEAPVAVTADANGDVYEADVGNGYINEYFPGRNSPTVASCQPTGGGSVYGVAVDSKNDVFATVVSYVSETFELVEYPGGLNNCSSPTNLLSVYGNSIAVDKNGNLLIADPLTDTVDVVDAPSYSTVNATIGSGFCEPTNVRLNKANTLAFVTDTCNNTVTVVNYPTGTNAAVLGSGNGLTYPKAAVESPNAVY